MVRKDVLEMAGYNPGPPLDELIKELGLESMDEMGTNENAWGPSPKVVEAVTRAMARAQRYPEASCLGLKKALARQHGVGIEMISVANGADNLLSLLGLTFLNPGDEVVMADITFPIYAKIAQLSGAVVRQVALKDLRHDLEAMARAVTPKTKLLFICNPNNPTATAVEGAELDAFLDNLPETCLAVVDEVYRDFSEERYWPHTIARIKQGRPVLSLGSFSKLHGLAGLRVGYALGPAELIAALDKVREPFAVNRLAQAAAEASLEDLEYRRFIISETQKGIAYLGAELNAMGVACPKSQTNFLYVDLGRPSQAVCGELLKRGVMIRSMEVWGAPDCARITVGTREQNDRLLSVLKEVLA